jgi:glycerol-3-phosphate dehydrogenase (NAD(P)+)
MCVLSGPSIATELAQHKPATMVASSSDSTVAKSVQDLFDVPWLRIYSHDDPLGVELAGATKNVIALAAGMLDGLGIGVNAKSALLARGIAEIARLGAAMGAQVDTFFGVAGVGDLATTCFSPSGRNRSCGERLGRGESLDEVLASTTSVVEGVPTTKAVKRLAEEKGVEMPITAAVHAILFEGLSPTDAIRELMRREQKAERIA